MLDYIKEHKTELIMASTMAGLAFFIGYKYALRPENMTNVLKNYIQEFGVGRGKDEYINSVALWIGPKDRDTVTALYWSSDKAKEIAKELIDVAESIAKDMK